MKNTDATPLVYACSGCSSAAQLANHVALQLDRRGLGACAAEGHRLQRVAKSPTSPPFFRLWRRPQASKAGTNWALFPHVSLRRLLPRRLLAEMSCIAGVGGDVPHLLKIAQSGRPIVALDGCPLACVKSCLARHGLQADRYHQLNTQGVRKRQHEDFDPAQAAAVLEHVSADLREHPLRSPPVTRITDPADA